MATSKRHIRKYFVPHTTNKYQPHLFRNTSLFAIFSICILLLGISIGNFVFLQKTVLGVNIASNVLIDMANNARSQSKVSTLARNQKLDYAAGMKASDMVENKYFAHFSPDGTTPWYFIHESGYNFIYAGENLAINFYESLDVQNAWMNSPTHRENLLNKNFKEVGVATKEGMYNGASSIYIVQMFGTEAKPKLENVFGDFKNEDQAKKSAIIDSRVAVAKEIPKEIPKIKVINESKDFIAVKNTEAIEKTDTKVAGVETYSSFWDRLVFNLSRNIQVIYFVFIGIIGVAFFIRIFIEYERQHYRHILYSLGFLFLIMFLAIINYNFIISQL